MDQNENINPQNPDHPISPEPTMPPFPPEQPESVCTPAQYAIPVYPPQPEKRKKHSGALIAVALFCSLLGSALGAGSILLANWLFGNSDSSQTNEPSTITGILQGNRENTVLDTIPIDTGRLMTPAEVYAANVNSTVGITTAITTNYWGFQSTSAASGSGFILTADGYIVTNHHVVDSSSSISVTLYDGTTYDARLVGSDESNDIAVLKVDAQNLSPVILGDSDNLNVGDSVIAIGNPLGELTFTLTAGAVSAKDRSVTFSNAVTMELIQTDCAINSGNSGGALFNLYGEVVGITNAKYSSSSSGASIDNIGFAIPMNRVRGMIRSIIEKGYISKPYVGISVTTVSKDAQQFGIPSGAAVQQIAQDSPAQDAGLQVGDVITHCNGQDVTGSSELVRMVSKTNIGDILTVTVYRKGETLTLSLTVGEQIQQTSQEPTAQNRVPQNPGTRP